MKNLILLLFGATVSYIIFNQECKCKDVVIPRTLPKVKTLNTVSYASENPCDC
jgi:hypothetical protein